MESVTLQIHNIQSHENTQFTLHPGLNFILANDNNVGKSTVFKILTAVAKAPHNSPSKLRALVRNGCSSAYVRFTYDKYVTTAWFQQDKGYATRLFFEHTMDDGFSSRSVVAPVALIEALGIAIDRDGTLINFNQADSVQLISEISTEADSILTSVILDSNIEHMKENIGRFARQLDNDIRMTTVRQKSAQESLEQLSYNENAEEFFQELEVLQALCRVCDDKPGTPHLEKGDVGIGFDELSGIVELARNLSDIDFRVFNNDLSFYKDTEIVASLLQRLSRIQFGSLCKFMPSDADIQNLDVLAQTVKMLGPATRMGWSVVDTGTILWRKQQEKEALATELGRVSSVVRCPVRGEVFYSSEKCIPTGF